MANGKVRQCRGKGNCGYDDKVASFIEYVEGKLESIKKRLRKMQHNTEWKSLKVNSDWQGRSVSGQKKNHIGGFILMECNLNSDS